MILRPLLVAISIPIVALLLGVALTDLTPLGYDDWQWRYAVRVGLAVLAFLAADYPVRTLRADRRLLVAAFAGVLLLTNFNDIRDLRAGPARFMMMSAPTADTEGQIFEVERLLHTDQDLH